MLRTLLNARATDAARGELGQLAEENQDELIQLLEAEMQSPQPKQN
jgi:hypothetical protein